MGGAKKKKPGTEKVLVGTRLMFLESLIRPLIPSVWIHRGRTGRALSLSLSLSFSLSLSLSLSLGVPGFIAEQD